MRRPRCRLRTLLILVGLLAVITGIEVNRRRWAYYRAQAAEYANHEEGSRGTGADCQASVDGLRARSRRALAAGDTRRAEAFATNAASMAGEVERQARHAEYHGRMRRKYERAARSLWLPVVSNRPSPE